MSSRIARALILNPPSRSRNPCR